MVACFGTTALISASITAGLCQLQSNTPAVKVQRLEKVQVKSIHFKMSFQGPLSSLSVHQSLCGVTAGPACFSKRKNSLHSIHRLINQMMLTPVLVAIRHQNTVVTMGYSSLYVSKTPHFPLSAQHVSTEYPDTFNNNDDMQVLLRLVCFWSIFTYPWKTGLVEVASLSRCIFSEVPALFCSSYLWHQMLFQHL